MNRRGFLGRALGLAAAAPAAAQQALNAPLSAGLNPGLALGAVDGYPSALSAHANSTRVLPRGLAIARVLNNPLLLAQVRRLAQRRVARVPDALDPDLAANRSFSLAAKVRLQYERNLRRCMDELLDGEDSPWQLLFKEGIDL